MNKKGQLGAVAVIVGVIVLIFVFFAGFDTVDASHKGVMIQFGNILGVQEPGIQWTGLFTNVEHYDMRTRKVELKMEGANGAATKEGQDVYATINVNYRIRPNAEVVVKLYQNIGREDNIEDVLNLKPIITEAFKQNTVKYGWEGVLDKREELKDKTVETIKEHFPNEYFEIESIVITNIGFSSAFESELEAKQVATQTALKEQNNLVTVEYQQKQEIEKYKAEAEKNRLQYTADTERLKAQKEQLTPEIIQKEWIAKWNGQLPMYVITSQENANTLMQLPSVQVK